MNIKEYISQNGGYISSAEAKEKSLYNQLLYEVEKGTIVRVRQGIYAFTVLERIPQTNQVQHAIIFY